MVPQTSRRRSFHRSWPHSGTSWFRASFPNRRCPRRGWGVKQTQEKRIKTSIKWPTTRTSLKNLFKTENYRTSQPKNHQSTAHPRFWNHHFSKKKAPRHGRSTDMWRGIMAAVGLIVALLLDLQKRRFRWRWKKPRSKMKTLKWRT